MDAIPERRSVLAGKALELPETVWRSASALRDRDRGMRPAKCQEGLSFIADILRIPGVLGTIFRLGEARGKRNSIASRPADSQNGERLGLVALELAALPSLLNLISKAAETQVEIRTGGERASDDKEFVPHFSAES